MTPANIAATASRYGWLPLCIMAGLWSLHCGQDSCWDLQNYHLYNAYALFHPARWQDIAFAQIQTYLNPILDIPLYLLNQTFPHAPRIIAFCMGFPAGFLIFATLRIALRLFPSVPAAVIATLFAATGSASLSQIGIATNEVLVAIPIMAALLLLLRALDPATQNPIANILCAGFIAGLATGAKLTAAPYAIGLAAALTVSYPPKRLPTALTTLALTGLIGATITAGPWMLHLYRQFQNPLFPIDNQIFKSPWAGPYSYADVRFFPRTTTQWLLYPLYWARPNSNIVTESYFADPRIAAALTAALFATIITLIRRPQSLIPPPPWRAIIVFWCVSYTLWEKLFSIYRYAIPLEITAGFIFAAAIRTLSPSRPILTNTAAALATLLIAQNTIIPDWHHIPFQHQATPLTLPPIPPHTLVISSTDASTAFIATKAPPDTVFIAANSNFALPNKTLLAKAIASAIAAWRGPIAIVEPTQGNQAGRAALAANYNITATNNCAPIISAYHDQDPLRLCAANRTIIGPDDQPPINLTFAPGDAGVPYGVSGWRQPEPFGMWSIAPIAIIKIPVNPRNTHPLLLTVVGFSIPDAISPGRHQDIYANGRLVAHWALNRYAETFTASIPAQPGATTLTITFHTLDPIGEPTTANPTERLGIALIQLTLLPAPS